MGHRAGFNLGPVPTRDPAALKPDPVDPAKFRGYSYLLDDPTDPRRNELKEEYRTKIGKDPVEARKILTALHNLLPLAKLEDNERIPSGYTYLLQFVAHDLVETSIPFWAAAEAGVPSRNMRDATLMLDTLYGGGPVACPIAFEPTGAMVDYRTKLRLGKVADAATIGPAVPACPYRDLARLKSEHPAPPSNLANPSQVYAADERSDDNTLLSQIVVLFSIVHNAIAAKLSDLGPQERFAHASTAVLWMYHAVIRYDLMKWLLDDKVYKVLLDRKADSDWMWKGEGVPLEFTHGAFRVGHAMVRPHYQFNTDSRFNVGQMLSGPTGTDADRDPLPSAWIVEWQRFFKLGPKKPNYSPKLAITQQHPLDYLGNFQPVAANSPPRLTMRDWLSAANARTWRLDKLIEAAERRYPKLSPMSTGEISNWLATLVADPLNNEDDAKIVKQSAAELRTDLPLPLYILREAEIKSGGACLGPLGSVIVGETIFRCLTKAESDLAHVVPAAETALGDSWKRISSITDMPELVKLAADWANLVDCPQIPFIARNSEG
jgi:hypothetical protein